MGTLKPDTTYIYERVNDVVYARESGSSTRREVGRDYDYMLELKKTNCGEI